MDVMKPQVKEEEEVELTPDEEAMLDAAIAEAEAGNFVDEEVVYAEFPKYVRADAATRFRTPHGVSSLPRWWLD